MLTEHERRVLHEIDRAEAADDPLFAVCLASMQASDARSARRTWLLCIRAAGLVGVGLAFVVFVGLIVTSYAAPGMGVAMAALTAALIAAGTWIIERRSGQARAGPVTPGGPRTS